MDSPAAPGVLPFILTLVIKKMLFASTMVLQPIPVVEQCLLEWPIEGYSSSLDFNDLCSVENDPSATKLIKIAVVERGLNGPRKPLTVERIQEYGVG